MSLLPADRSILSDNYRACSRVPGLGCCKISLGAATESEVLAWLNLLSGIASQEPENRPARPADTASRAEDYTVDSIKESPVSWVRFNIPEVFPFYLESLTVVETVDPSSEDGLPLTRQFPGTYTVAADVFDPAHLDYYKKHQDQWEAWVRSNRGKSGYTGGLSVNLLEIPAEALRAGEIDVRPLTLHALAPDGSAVDRGDVAAQAATANAFWQTFWATGATRTERGSVFPVAFLPVDRSSSWEFAEPFHERYVSLRRRLFGRSAIVSFALEALTARRALLFCSRTCQFKIAVSFKSSDAEVASADVLLAVNELNRTGFIDAYTGQNRERFGAWLAHESAAPAGQAWPYGTKGSTPKIKAAGHGIEDPLQAVRADSNDTDCVAIHRVVPYAGCAYLYQVMLETEELQKRGKIQGLDGDLLAGTNSTFFLNFPEEYSALHSAMNEPVALLVEDGQTRQVRTFRRAAFVLTESGEGFITTRAGNHLNSEVLVFEGESASTNYFEKSDQSFRDNKFGPLFFGAAVVGNGIVETFEESGTEVPPAGWLTGDSEAFGGRIDPTDVARVQVRRAGKLQEEKIRHAFAVGPLLVDEGEVVPLGESREEFRSLDMKGSPSLDETSQLTRTQLPEAMMDCAARGVPPTRFPYDWNVTRAPRSAIGVKADGSVIIAVVDGRADAAHSVGATLHELAVIMKEIGCVQAMNMDGGGSSVMFVNDPLAATAKLRPELRDGVVSLPSDMGGTERLLPVPLVVCRRKATAAAE